MILVRRLILLAGALPLPFLVSIANRAEPESRVILWGLRWVLPALIWGFLPLGLLLSVAAQGQPPARVVADCVSRVRQSTPVTPALPATFKIVSWNIEKGEDPQWVEDLETLPRPLDLILLQEAFYPSVFGDLLLPGIYESFSEGYQATDRQTGVLTVARAAPELHCALVAYEPWLGTPKATTVTRYGLSGASAPLLVVNVHAVNFELGLDGVSAQLDAIRRVFEGHSGPAILAGDFNTWSAARQDLLNRLVQRLQLQPIEFAPDSRTKVFGLPLDHIFIRGLQVLESGSTVSTGSDHNPLWATLTGAGQV